MLFTLPCMPWQNFGITTKMPKIVVHLVMNFDPITVIRDSLYEISSEDL